MPVSLSASASLREVIGSGELNSIASTADLHKASASGGTSLAGFLGFAPSASG